MKKILAVAVLAAMVLAVGCGSSGTDTSSDVPSITTIAELPRATSPMAAASVSTSESKGIYKAATTGLNLSTTTESNFSSSSSMGACQMFGTVKSGIQAAAQADMIMCFVEQMNSGGKFDNLTDADGNAVSIYDGEYHIFNLNVKQCTTDGDCAGYGNSMFCRISDGVCVSGARAYTGGMKCTADADCSRVGGGSTCSVGPDVGGFCESGGQTVEGNVTCATDDECSSSWLAADATNPFCNTTEGKCFVDGSVSQGPPDKIRMKIVKDDDGRITSFEMFMCKLSDSSSVQQEYVKQTIDYDSSVVNNLAMRAIGRSVDSNGSGWHSVRVAGDLNESNVYKSKTITLADNGSWGGGTTWREGTLTQTPGAFTFSGYDTGSYESEADSGSYTNEVYGLGEMLGDTAATIASLAMGDGAVNVKYSGVSSGESYNQAATVDAWLGDTGLPVTPATGSTFYDGASAGTIPTAATSEINIEFSEADGEVWDCSGTAIDLAETTESALQTACSQYNLSHNWINCYGVISQNLCTTTIICGPFSPQGDAAVAACEACFPGGSIDGGTEQCLLDICNQIPGSGKAECQDDVSSNACFQ